LADGLITNAVKPDLKDWQNNKIRTLADLQSSIEKRAEQWLNQAQHHQHEMRHLTTKFNPSWLKNRPHLSKVPDTEAA